MNREKKPSIYLIDRKELSDFFLSKKEPAYRSGQVFDWVFKKHIVSPKQMTNLSPRIKNLLAEEFYWDLPEIVTRTDADDASTKLLLKGEDGNYFETVILRYENRTSLCVSSQIGCKYVCSFCRTGQLGFVRDLDKNEILGQVLLANALLKDEKRSITHVVFMGMGEPLDNLEAVVWVVRKLADENSFGINPKHLTISTVGLVPGIRELANLEIGISLAISLNAARDDLRNELMPINKVHNLVELKNILLEYQSNKKGKLTFEYILIKDKNCSLKDVKDLVKYLHGFRAKVNLICFNAFENSCFEQPSPEEIRAFQKYLSSRSIPAPVRYSKGLDISAACGNLIANFLNKEKNAR